MDYEDMIEEEPKPEAEFPPEEIATDPVEPKAKSPWKAFILTGLLAGLIGAAGGGYGVYEGIKRYAPASVPQAEVDLSPIEARLNKLTDRVTEAEAEALDAANRPAVDYKPVDMPEELSDIEARLTALETTSAAEMPTSQMEERLAALEAAPKPEIDPEALSALQAAQKDGFEWPDTTALEARLGGLEAQAETFLAPAADKDALEDRIKNLEVRTEERSDAAATTADQTVAAPIAALPNDLMDRIDTLESEIETLRNAEPDSVDEEKMSALEVRLSALENRPSPTPVVEKVAILAFPKAQMIAAVEENMEGGVIRKTLSRHIRVKDANDPLTLIDGIETNLSEGQLAVAAEKFERLPSPVRAAGQAWYESVKAGL